MFRKYEFTYHQNEFGQTELESFTESNGDGGEFYSYSFEYEGLSEVTDADGQVMGFEGFGDSEVVWDSVANDTFPGINRTVSYGVGASLYAGIKVDVRFWEHWKLRWKTVLNAGVSGGYSRSNTLTNSTLVDIDGDRLPDAVWRDGDSIRAYRNTGEGFDTGRELVFNGVDDHLNRSRQEDTASELQPEYSELQGLLLFSVTGCTA